jgi:hypothetical protein
MVKLIIHNKKKPTQKTPGLGTKKVQSFGKSSVVIS